MPSKKRPPTVSARHIARRDPRFTAAREAANTLRLDWRAEGHCRQADPALFFPHEGGPIDPAKEVCAGCPVQAWCLAEALDRKLQGIWGGTSQKERHAMTYAWHEAKQAAAAGGA